MKLFKTVDSKTWNSLLVLEQDMILSAFELPQFNQGKRLKEGVHLNGSVGGHDAVLFKRFVQEAAIRSPGKKPRIAFVTSAANNNFDAVDFYRDILQQAGAEVVWWPIDWTMNKAIFGGHTCKALPQLRQVYFSQLGRERVFPDLAAQQSEACEIPDALAEIPNNVQGIFLDGGDQWLHQNTFFDTNGNPNIWLTNLKTAFLKGDLVVAGTSAGTAVQSGNAMITNGTSANALQRGVKKYGSMPEGCEQAKRCPKDLQEDDLSYWPNAGLSLVGPLLMDTHVSERKRELRFISLLAHVQAQAGIGIDETSAVMLKIEKSAISVEAFGQSGAWWFMKPSTGITAESIVLNAHYLVPGKVLYWENGSLVANNLALFTSRPGSLDVTDALEGSGIRDTVWNMVSKHFASVELSAPEHQIQIFTTPQSRQWQGSNGHQGITDLLIKISKNNHLEK
jgi:cyanophycinase-like exopeptidase